MAWTLKEAYNIDNELALTTAVTNFQRLDAAMKKHCQAILEGAITASHERFTGRNVTNNQLVEFAINYPNNRYTANLRPHLIHSGRWPADPYATTITDATIELIAIEAIWPICNKIGTGSL
jgi:hypothetical protein